MSLKIPHVGRAFNYFVDADCQLPPTITTHVAWTVEIPKKLIASVNLLFLYFFLPTIDSMIKIVRLHLKRGIELLTSLSLAPK